MDSNPRKDLSCYHNSSARAFFWKKCIKVAIFWGGGKKSEVVIFRQNEFLKVLPEQTRILKKLHAILLWQVRTVDSGFLLILGFCFIMTTLESGLISRIKTGTRIDFYLFFKWIRPITHNLVFLILFMCVNKIGTNLSSMLQRTTSDKQLFYIFFMFSYGFPIIHHYLCQCQIWLNNDDELLKTIWKHNMTC